MTPGEPAPDVPSGSAPRGAADPAAALAAGDLVEACRCGSEGAWRELVRRYGRLVYSVPHGYGLPPELCEDVFQMVFTALVQGLDSIRDPDGLPKWLITAAHRHTWRALDRRPEPFDGPGGAVEPAPPEDYAERHEREQLVREGLRRLGGRCEALLTALYLDGERPDYERAAARLRLPIGSIGPMRGRCLRKLVRLLAPALGRS